MSEQTEYIYDVFISYSHADKAWVWGKLLPRLEGAGLRVCIDDRDFEIGVSSLVNMERAVDNSRHTLIVLTPAWVESQWAEFESLLASTTDPAGRQRKLIPLMLESCWLPPRIRILTYADFTQSHDHVDQFNRLMAQLQGTETTLDQLYSEVKQAEAKQDWQRMITVCQEIIGIAPLYRDVQRLLRKARFHSARQCAGVIWARHKTSIVILAVLLLMVAGIPVLGKWTSVWQPTPTPPTPHPISFLTPSSTSTWAQTPTATQTIAATPTPTPSQPIIAGFLITHSGGFTSTIEARGIITVVTSRIILLRPQLSITPWPENTSCLWGNARAQSRARVSPTDSCTTSYQAPDNAGPDFIVVDILEGDEQIDWNYMFVQVEAP